MTAPRDTCLRLDDYLDGELSEAESAAFERHIESCPGCAATVREARRLSGWLERARGRLEEPPGCLLVGLREELASRRRHRLRRRALLLASAALVLLGIALYTLLRAPNDRGEREELVRPTGQESGAPVPADPPLPEVTVTFDEEVIAVPLIRKPEVTIVFLYHDVRVHDIEHPPPDD